LPFGLPLSHLVIMAVAAFIVFVPSSLPEIAKGIGAAISEFQWIQNAID